MRLAFSVVRGIGGCGGIEKYTAELGSRLVRNGHSVTVYSMTRYDKGPVWARGMRVVPCPALPGKFGEKLTAGAFAAVRMLTHGYDVVHQHSIAAGAFNWLAGLPKASVLQMHGIEWRRTKWCPSARLLVRGLERLAVAQYRHFTAVSKSQCRILEELYGIKPVYIPTATEVQPPAPAELIRSEHGLEPGGYILFASRLVPEKGAHFLIDAFRTLRTDLNLVIAGDAPTEPAYVQSLHARAAGDPRIRFLGMVRGRKLRELFSNCRIYVQPSVIEGLSIALLEAMSFGKCCLVSDIEENHEAIGEAGATFASENADDLARKLAQLITNRARAVELGQAARERVSREYSWDVVVPRIEELYSSIQASA